MAKRVQPRKAARGKHVPGAVRVYSNGALGISRDLLGEFAGDRNLRFRITVTSHAGEIALEPGVSVGWPVYYGGDAAKSPRMNLRRFFRNVKMSYPAVGVYPAVVSKGRLIYVRFSRREK